MSPILKKGVVEGASQTLGDVDQHQKAHANNAQLRALGGRTQAGLGIFGHGRI